MQGQIRYSLHISQVLYFYVINLILIADGVNVLYLVYILVLFLMFFLLWQILYLVLVFLIKELG